MPSILTHPEVGSVKPLKCEKSVDLPAPLGPIIATFSPFSISILIFFKARVPSGYVKLKFSVDNCIFVMLFS